MKNRIKQGAILAGVITFTLTACDPDRNKASAGGSADTVFTESAKHLDSARRQPKVDSTTANKDSAGNNGNADPSGRLKNQNEH